MRLKLKNFLGIVALFWCGLLSAAELDLQDSPLFLAQQVRPNVFFTVDDSGSMDWEILTEPHWHYCAFDPDANGSFSSSNCGFEVTNGLWRSRGRSNYRYFYYMYETGDNVYDDRCHSSNANAVSHCTESRDKDWRINSSDLNFVYYNPTTSYQPWPGPCRGNSKLCTNANFKKARSNPRKGSAGYTMRRNLTWEKYDIWIDDRGYTGSRPQRGSNSNATSTPNGEVDLWDSHIEISFRDPNIRVNTITYSPNSSGLNPTTVTRATISNDGQCYNVLGTAELAREVFNGTYTWTSTGADGCRTYEQTRQNFANWYQYHRRRSFAAKSAIANVVTASPNYRYGISVINRYSDLFVEVPSVNTSNYASHNEGLLRSLYDYRQRAHGTPLRQGLERAGKYFDDTLSGKSNPIHHACQQNFSILLTDGYWNGSNPSSSIGDSDGDGHSRTLADVADYYYKKDLSPLDNNVPANPFDPATHQHMVTYTVAFGVTGNLQDTNNTGWPDLNLGSSGNWGNPFSDEKAKIDDMWHAAFNGKGIYVSAQKPETVATKLAQSLANIAARVSSAATAAQNSSTLNTSSKIYRGTFDTNGWAGGLFAYNISTTGTLSTTPLWNAGCVLTGGTCASPAGSNSGISSANRTVIVKNPLSNNPKAVGLDFPDNYAAHLSNGNLPRMIKNWLAHAPHAWSTNNSNRQSKNQAYGESLINYIRGARTDEQSNGGSLRTRTSLLGDLIHSNPVHVGPPARSYLDSFESSPYSAFKASHVNRTPVIYVGANDGLLHAFNANTGAEVLAFMPSASQLLENLGLYATPTYTHKYFVDGQLTEADVYTNGAWRTVLGGGLRNGGQGLFLLDVTDPSQFSEGNAANIYLWEFTDDDDADLGYTHSKPVITKIKTANNTTKWAMIVGNGYNNTESDGNASGNGQAALFVILLEGGANGTWTLGTDYFKLSTGVGSTSTPNGLATPFAVDADADGIADYIYAGDQQGNLWKFDLTANAPASWSVQKLFQAYDTTAGDQPITAAPIVTIHPEGLSKGYMIYFGTGKYLETSDNSSTGQTTQAFYAIWDKKDGATVSKSDLLQQSILSEVTNGFDTDNDGNNDVTYSLRHTSDYPINWDAPQSGGDPAQHLGWYIDLEATGQSNLGERVIAQAIKRDQRIIFTTLLPPTSACQFGGESWLMELRASNGGYLPTSPFDFNMDGYFDDADLANIGDYNNDGNIDFVPAGGMKSTVGLTPQPAVMLTADKTAEIKVLNGSTGMGTVRENTSLEPLGRQNWRQLR